MPHKISSKIFMKRIFSSTTNVPISTVLIRTNSSHSLSKNNSPWSMSFPIKPLQRSLAATLNNTTFSSLPRAPPITIPSWLTTPKPPRVTRKRLKWFCVQRKMWFSGGFRDLILGFLSAWDFRVRFRRQILACRFLGWILGFLGQVSGLNFSVQFQT